MVEYPADGDHGEDSLQAQVALLNWILNMVNNLISTLAAALAGLTLCAAQDSYTNETDPYYGQSPAVYPTRQYLLLS